MKKTLLSVTAALLLTTGAIPATARTLLFIGDSITAGGVTPDYWVWDGIHPTTAAHYRMSRLWIDIMEPVLALPKE